MLLKLVAASLLALVSSADAQVSTAPASAPSYLYGRVIDTADARLANVSIQLIGVGEVLTDREGEYLLRNLAPGTYLLRATRIGYAPVIRSVTLQQSEAMRLDLELGSVTPQLAGVTVTAERTRAIGRAGFDRRLAQHVGGMFITADDIARRNPVLTEYVFRDVPFLHSANGTLFVGGGDHPSALPPPPIALGKGAGQCTSVQVFVDGSHTADGFDVNTIPPQAIAGIEVYRGPSDTPSQFRTYGTICGSVLIWTK